MVAGNLLVVAEINDLQLLHVAHLLGQGLQFIGVQEQHSGVLPVAHLPESEGETKQTRVTAVSNSTRVIRLNPDCSGGHGTGALTSGGSWTRKL